MQYNSKNWKAGRIKEEGETGSGKSDPPSSDKAGLWRGKDAEGGKTEAGKLGSQEAEKLKKEGGRHR